jgi:AcrR family transcriptional regulator
MGQPASAPRAEQTRARILAAARAALLAGDGDFELADLARRAGTSDRPAVPPLRLEVGA